MTREHACFLRFLRDYVHGRPSALSAGEVDWNRIVRDAKEQSLGGILYVQCREFLPENSAALKALHQEFYSAVYTYFNGTAALKQAGEAFEKEKVAYLPFKGEILRRYYPDPELRTMGDVDLLIHHRDREAVDEIMGKLGYERFVDNHAVWTYIKPNLMFEIHNVMFYEYLTNPVDYREYFEHIWETAVSVGNGCRYEPEPNRHFLYLMCHTAKHIINHGIGFRAFLDIVFMARKEKNLDWDWIARELDRLRLLDFTKTCFALCRRWFDVALPFPGGEVEEGFFEEVTAKMFHDGTFGLQNEENEGAYSAKELQRSGKSYWRTAVRLTWKKMFPPYEDMQLIPWYRFVDGRPWLMPLAWVYRWIYTMTHKFKHTRDLFLEPFAKREVIEKREQMINSWKL